MIIVMRFWESIISVFPAMIKENETQRARICLWSLSLMNESRKVRIAKKLMKTPTAINGLLDIEITL
jgi:hypothetical protein